MYVTARNLLVTLTFAVVLVACDDNTQQTTGEGGDQSAQSQKHDNQEISDSTSDKMSTGSTELQATTAKLSPTEGNDVSGTVHFTRASDGVRVKASISGLSPGKHGFHVHENGDCSSPDGKSAGGHFNPTDQPHGAPDDDKHHVGDMGNITADDNGKATVDEDLGFLSLTGDNSIVGKAIIVHGGEDDLTSQPSGDAGPRVACGVIEEDG